MHVSSRRSLGNQQELPRDLFFLQGLVFAFNVSQAVCRGLGLRFCCCCGFLHFNCTVAASGLRTRSDCHQSKGLNFLFLISKRSRIKPPVTSFSRPTTLQRTFTLSRTTDPRAPISILCSHRSATFASSSALLKIRPPLLHRRNQKNSYLGQILGRRGTVVGS